RELDRDPRQLRRERHRLGAPLTMTVIEIDHHVPVQAEDRQDHEDEEVETEEEGLDGAHRMAGSDLHVVRDTTRCLDRGRSPGEHPNGSAFLRRNGGLGASFYYTRVHTGVQPFAPN